MFILLSVQGICCRFNYFLRDGKNLISFRFSFFVYLSQSTNSLSTYSITCAGEGLRLGLSTERLASLVYLWSVIFWGPTYYLLECFNSEVNRSSVVTAARQQQVTSQSTINRKCWVMKDTLKGIETNVSFCSSPWGTFITYWQSVQACYMGRILKTRTRPFRPLVISSSCQTLSKSFMESSLEYL